MARMSEAKCKEMIRGGTSRMLYPYPEHEKPFSVVILDTSLGDMEMEFYFNEAPKAVTASWSFAGAAIMSHVCLTGFKRIYGYNAEIQRRLGEVENHSMGPIPTAANFSSLLAPPPWLNGKNTIFGQVLKGPKGLDVLKRMNVLPTNKYDRPLEHVFLTRTLVIERLRHFEWRPQWEDYGCYNSKGSQVGQYRRGLHSVLRLEKVVPRSTSFLKIKRMSAKVIKPTSQGGWELYRKRAY